MALQQNYTDSKTNITITNAYIKVNEVTFLKGVRVIFKVGIYNSGTDQDNGKEPLECFTYELYSARDGTDWTDHFEITDLQAAGMDIVKACYNYLKTLSDYSGATDV